METRSSARMMAEMTWPEISEAIHRGAGVILVCGATEQHGPHLPIGTDAMLGTDLARALSRDLDLIVAPTMTYGCRSRPLSGGGQGFVGTTSLSGTTFIAVVREVLAEFIRHGWSKIVVMAHHMENSNFVYDAAFEAMKQAPETRARIMVIESPYFGLTDATTKLLFPDEFPGWNIEHASIVETSLMLHVHPTLVRTDRIADDRPERIVAYDMLPIHPDFVAKSGALWKASQGTAGKGERVWDDVTEGLRRAVATELFV